LARHHTSHEKDALMSSSFMHKLTVVATSLSLGLLVLASSASADVQWSILPSSNLGGFANLNLDAAGPQDYSVYPDAPLTGHVDPNDPNSAEYNYIYPPDPNGLMYVPPIAIGSVPQTDSGTSGFGYNVQDPSKSAPGSVNSLVGKGTGYFTTYGSSPTSSLDFGAKPSTTPTLTQLTVSALPIGNFYPDSTSFSGGSAPTFDVNGIPQYHFGNAQPADSAATLITTSPLSGFNALTGGDFSTAGKDNGRIAVFGLQSLPISAAPIPVTSGTFDGTKLSFMGTLGVSVNVALAADPNGAEQKPFGITAAPGDSDVDPPAASGFPQIGTNEVDNTLTAAQAVGHITRSGALDAQGHAIPNTGPNYIMTVPFSTTDAISHNTPVYPQLTGDGTPQLVLTLTINMVAQANVPLGDGNFDGSVNGLDLSGVLGHWLATDSTHLGIGDANGDGVVNGLDLSLVLGHWLQHSTPLGGGGGGSVGPTAVPEPGSLLLFGFGAVTMLVMARRRARR
jgi:hypothetical protein